MTTQQTTGALIAILTNNPEIQEKIHREIDSVIGNNEPRLDDRHRMHYTSAVQRKIFIQNYFKAVVVTNRFYFPNILKFTNHTVELNLLP